MGFYDRQGVLPIVPLVQGGVPTPLIVAGGLEAVESGLTTAQTALITNPSGLLTFALHSVSMWNLTAGGPFVQLLDQNGIVRVVLLPNLAATVYLGGLLVAALGGVVIGAGGTASVSLSYDIVTPNFTT